MNKGTQIYIPIKKEIMTNNNCLYGLMNFKFKVVLFQIQGCPLKAIDSLPLRALTPQDITHDYRLYIPYVFLSVCIEYFLVKRFQMSFQDNYRPCNHCLQEYNDHYHQKCAHLSVVFFL